MGSSSMEDDQSLKTPSGKSSSILCISWFIIPLTVDTSSINHSYWSYKPTERYLGGTTLYATFYMFTQHPPGKLPALRVSPPFNVSRRSSFRAAWQGLGTS